MEHVVAEAGRDYGTGETGASSGYVRLLHFSSCSLYHLRCCFLHLHGVQSWAGSLFLKVIHLVDSCRAQPFSYRETTSVDVQGAQYLISVHFPI